MVREKLFFFWGRERNKLPLAGFLFAVCCKFKTLPANGWQFKGRTGKGWENSAVKAGTGMSETGISEKEERKEEKQTAQ